jgi:hypothetical protein
MAIRDQILLGCLAVVAVVVLLTKYKSVSFFGRALSLNEVISVCWVAFSIYIGAVASYYALKWPLGLSQAANGPATAMAVCASLFSIVSLGRIQPDWDRVTTRSLFGLLIVLWLIGAAVYFLR